MISAHPEERFGSDVQYAGAGRRERQPGQCVHQGREEKRSQNKQLEELLHGDIGARENPGEEETHADGNRRDQEAQQQRV